MSAGRILTMICWGVIAGLIVPNIWTALVVSLCGAVILNFILDHIETV